jgi:hypothetical protein
MIIRSCKSVFSSEEMLLKPFPIQIKKNIVSFLYNLNNFAHFQNIEHLDFHLDLKLYKPMIYPHLYLWRGQLQNVYF